MRKRLQRQKRIIRKQLRDAARKRLVVDGVIDNLKNKLASIFAELATLFDELADKTDLTINWKLCLALKKKCKAIAKSLRSPGEKLKVAVATALKTTLSITAFIVSFGLANPAFTISVIMRIKRLNAFAKYFGESLFSFIMKGVGLDEKFNNIKSKFKSLKNKFKWKNKAQRAAEKKAKEEAFWRPFTGPSAAAERQYWGNSNNISVLKGPMKALPR